MLEASLQQVGQALAYYAALVVIMRISGKRLAGQMQTLDLIILITLGVVLQTWHETRRSRQAMRA